MMKRIMMALMLAMLVVSGCAREQASVGKPVPTGAGNDAVTAQAKEETEMRIRVGNAVFNVKLADNDAARALRDLLAEGPRTIPASNYGGFEKVCKLGVRLPTQDTQTTTQAGDVMLYSGDQIVIFYGANSWAYTRLGKVEGATADELRQALSGPETEITLSLAK